jgi:hypothetical protein
MNHVAKFKPIRINNTNIQKLDLAFEMATWKPRKIVLTGQAADAAAFLAERVLENRGIPESKRKGASAVIIFYKAATLIEVSRNTRGWSLISLQQLDVSRASASEIEVSITPEQAAIITKDALKGLTVKSTTA